VALIDGWESQHHRVTLVHLPSLYDKLRREHAFAGSELNIEGAVQFGDRLRFFGRGNGAPRAGVRPINATCDLDWPALFAHLRAPDRSPPPPPERIVQYELGAIDGIPLSFTDAALSGDTLLYCATAEESPDVTRDGRVVGSTIGVIDPHGRVQWAVLTDGSEKPLPWKIEGLAPAAESGKRLFVVVDADDPDMASELCTVELRGAW
jgi:hypothetical protein